MVRLFDDVTVACRIASRARDRSARSRAAHPCLTPLAAWSTARSALRHVAAEHGNCARRVPDGTCADHKSGGVNRPEHPPTEGSRPPAMTGRDAFVATLDRP